MFPFDFFCSQRRTGFAHCRGCHQWRLQHATCHCCARYLSLLHHVHLLPNVCGPPSLFFLFLSFSPSLFVCLFGHVFFGRAIARVKRELVSSPFSQSLRFGKRRMHRFTGMVLIALVHGVLVLPVLLSLMGPPPYDHVTASSAKVGSTAMRANAVEKMPDVSL